MIMELQKGENINLSQLYPELNELALAVSCVKKTDDKRCYETLSTAFLLTGQEKVRSKADYISVDQPTSENQAVQIKESAVKVTLSKIPTGIEKIVFVLVLHNSEQRKQTFAQFEKVAMRLFSFHNRQELARCAFDFAHNETAIMTAELYRHKNQWKFKTIGAGFADGIAVWAQHFGVQTRNFFEAPPPAPPSVPPPAPPPKLKNNRQKKPRQKTTAIRESKNLADDGNIPMDRINIHNTRVFTEQEHYQPIVNWLELKNIRAEVNTDASNTTGFFDEIAVELGSNYALLKIVADTINRRYRIGKERAYIDLSRHTQDDITSICKFCQEMYNYAFVARYFYDKETKKIILHLHSANKIISFFNGEWLEWFAFMKVIALCEKNNWSYSCTRNMIIDFDKANKYEIDVFFLINEKPLFIECKSGEYRQYIDKYAKLRRKLFINKSHFLYLILETDTDKTEGLSTMFDITFINQHRLVEYIDTLSFSYEAEKSSALSFGYETETNTDSNNSLLGRLWKLVSKE